MEFHTKYYLIESGKILEVAESYRDEHQKMRTKMYEYVKGIGGDGYKLGFSDAISAIKFPNNKQPKNFKKPDRDGCCSPYKKSDYNEEFKKYKLPGCLDAVQKHTGCHVHLSYSKDGDLIGSQCIGHPINPVGIYWYSDDGPLLLALPDVHKYVSSIKGNNENIIFEHDADKWNMEEQGAREILKEEWDLMVAKHKAKK